MRANTHLHKRAFKKSGYQQLEQSFKNQKKIKKRKQSQNPPQTLQLPRTKPAKNRFVKLTNKFFRFAPQMLIFPQILSRNVSFLFLKT